MSFLFTIRSNCIRPNVLSVKLHSVKSTFGQMDLVKLHSGKLHLVKLVSAVYWYHFLFMTGRGLPGVAWVLMD